MRLIRLKYILVVAATLVAVGSAQGLGPEDKCEADKNKIAGKYAFCRQNAEAKAIKKGEAADYSKCDSKLTLTVGQGRAEGDRQGDGVHRLGVGAGMRRPS